MRQTSRHSLIGSIFHGESFSRSVTDGLEKALLLLREFVLSVPTMSTGSDYCLPDPDNISH